MRKKPVAKNNNVIQLSADKGAATNWNGLERRERERVRPSSPRGQAVRSKEAGLWLIGLFS